MKTNKKIIIISFLIIIAIIGGLYYFLKFKERNIVNVETCIKAGYPLVQTTPSIQECRTLGGKKFELHISPLVIEETDEEIIANYKGDNFTVIGSKVNPYNQDQKLIILTFHDYKKFNEPAPKWCGEHSTNCYILLKTKDNINVIARAYSGSYQYWDKGLKADFTGENIDNIPLIKFLDKENVVLRSNNTLSGQMSFLKINLSTKEVSPYK